MNRFLEQVAIEAAQMYLTENDAARFSRTVRVFRNLPTRGALSPVSLLPSPNSHSHRFFFFSIFCSNCFHILANRQLRNFPTKLSSTSSLISHIWRSVEWVSEKLVWNSNLSSMERRARFFFKNNANANITTNDNYFHTISSHYLSSLASDRLRYEALAECLVATGNFR